VKENEIKTIATFTMVLGTLVLILFISIRAGTPCRFWIGRYFSETSEISERPHNGTAVLCSDGSIYYSPKPGFTGRDSVRVQRAACNYSGTWHADPFHDWCGHLARTSSFSLSNTF
jgi:hypothetical protein